MQIQAPLSGCGVCRGISVAFFSARRSRVTACPEIILNVDLQVMRASNDLDGDCWFLITVRGVMSYENFDLLLFVPV